MECQVKTLVQVWLLIDLIRRASLRQHFVPKVLGVQPRRFPEHTTVLEKYKQKWSFIQIQCAKFNIVAINKMG
jgi:hypothetical protein